MTSSVPAVHASHAEGSDLQAVLLDMDGTLVDTEDLWWEAESEVFAELGHVLDERERGIVIGGPMTRSVAHLIEATGVELTVEQLAPRINARFVELIGRGVPLMPGAHRLLAELAAHQVPTALVSASHRHIIDTVLRSLGPEHFALTVAGDEVARTKPHPDPYLLAAARLGAEPARCVVVEDTLTGVTAAEAAGCRVIAVPSLVPVEPAPGRTVVASLEQVDLTFLRSLITAVH
ncbi:MULTISPECIES: HAD family hydrolase [Streptomycetaceae]|uniref:Hydrolase n=1 Tax=Streptantibioticus cattleyicolor (strain ATCC 35852 / DSM 46488 / JCM 4925 / NBRC 14057 / NRRL 8057) TaxID=1003195 RepID=F8K2K9_STREN|nr:MULTISPECIES: HAD family phosphatase [Streptomycetaceae]AEW97520.1 hydrolase [Streptantibioticus cattleyicolor NRRL 8057 = DSM 46488]MYS61953.1 HAD-IA family hydrolase [Streptomyces sp. SID5468]CCB77844.1 putative hydrolase [Streptantibioticus cattleyicolor NRRL 8057 = DSM 46488]